MTGKKIIDNQPLLGRTGYALRSDAFRLSPIYLQGDHTDANARDRFFSRYSISTSWSSAA